MMGLYGNNSNGPYQGLRPAIFIPNSIPISVATGVTPTPEPTIESNSNILMLFNNGNQCESVTGGWHGFYYGGTNSSLGSVNITQKLEINTWDIWCHYAFETNNSIDFSGYSNIVFEIDEATRDNVNGTFDYGIKSNNASDYNPQSTDLFNSKKVYKFSLQGINEDKITVRARNGGSIKVSKIYLEK